MKVCSKCKIEKEISEFFKELQNKDGHKHICKICSKEYCKEYNIKNRKKIQSQKKEYRINNIEKLLSHDKVYYIKNKEKKQSYQKEHYINNREKKLSHSKEYHINNREKINEYYRNKRLNDPIYKLKDNVRARLNQYLKSTGITKNKKTFDIVGCSPPELKEHLERQFVDGMSWNKMGKEIHIDHIIPLSSADNEDEIYKLCHYSNLQPLWAEDNLSKGNKIPHDYDWSDEFDANKVIDGGVKV